VREGGAPAARTGGVFRDEDQEFGAVPLFAQAPDTPGVMIRDTGIHGSTYDGIQFETGGGAVPDVRIGNVTVDRSTNGSGVLAMGGARGSATPTDVTVTGSAEGKVLIEPGSPFAINRWSHRATAPGPPRRATGPYRSGTGPGASGRPHRDARVPRPPRHNVR
ncbi:hypothetical protein ACFU5P_26140, partial [Streptomyces sp. NPDC057433]